MLESEARLWHEKGTLGLDFKTEWRKHMKAVMDVAERQYDQMFPKCPTCGQNKCKQYHIGYPDHDGYCDHCTCKCSGSTTPR